MSINYAAVLVASVAEFIVGAIWYMPVFGKAWGEIHGFPKLSKAEQAKAQKQMMPMLAVQFMGTLLTTAVLAELMRALPDYSVYSLAFLVWIGFFVPTQASAVIFGGTEGKWVVKKIAIMAGASLLCLLVAAAILGVF